MKSCKTSDCSRDCFIRWLQDNKLLIATFCGVIIGITLGFVLKRYELSHDSKIWISLWGDLFLRMLKLIILPMIISCLITGVSSLESSAGGKLGAVTLVYIFGTHLMSVTIAAIFGVILQPGSKWHAANSERETALNRNGTNSTVSAVNKEDDKPVNYTDIISDFIRNLFPDNFVRACLQHEYTKREETVVEQDGINRTETVTTLLHRDGTNTLGIIVFSLAIGFAIAAAGKEGKPLLNVFKSLSKIIFILMNVIIWYSPLAIISLIASSIMTIKNIESVAASVAIFMLAFLLACIVHQFIALPMLYFIIIRKNPFRYYFYLLEGILAGFGPPSSAAGVPVMIPMLKEKQNIDPRVVDFFMPIAMTVNRGGSVIFIVISVLFIANTFNVGLGFGSVVLLCILTSFLGSAVASVPSSSVLVAMTVCAAVNVPLGDRIAIILALDWLNDRIRTTNNLASTGYGCAIVEKFCKSSLTNLETVDDSISETSSLLHSKNDSKKVFDREMITIEDDKL